MNKILRLFLIFSLAMSFVFVSVGSTFAYYDYGPGGIYDGYDNVCGNGNSFHHEYENPYNGNPPENPPPECEITHTCETGVTSTPTPTPKIPACGSVCSTPADCLGARDGCTFCDVAGSKTCKPPVSTPSPTPKVPACGVPCDIPGDCQAARDGCTVCAPNAGGTKVCSAPTPTPTPKVPACGVPCDIPGDCQAARDGCTVCQANASGTKVCSLPSSTPTPTPKIPACGTACTTPADCLGARDSCTSCINNTCQKAPTPTPNPFSQTMCKCDGITVDPPSFTSGQKLSVTAYAKVEGGDTSYAKVPNILFTSEHYTDPAHGIRDVPYEVPIATTIVENTASKVRYKSVWSYTVPTNPDPKQVYKLRAVPQCVQKQASVYGVQQVAGAETSTVPQKNFISSFVDYIMGIFGRKATIQSNNGDALQLDTLKVGEITATDHCSYIEFKVK